MQNIHLDHIIVRVFNFLTPSAEIFPMIITESPFWARKIKVPEAIHHIIYTIHKSEYANPKQLRPIYFQYVQYS